MTDLKARWVSNWVTHPIIVLGVIIFVTQDIELSYLHLIFILFFLIAYKVGGLGSADLKVLIPIVISLSFFPLLGFLALSAIFTNMLGLKNKYNIPMFVPIYLGYIPTLILS